LIKDYNLQVYYHPGKANVVADALSRKSHCNYLVDEDSHLSHLLHPIMLHNITVDCSLRSQIIELQKTDVGVFHIKQKMKEQETKHFRVDDKGILWFKDRLVVPKDKELRNQIMTKAHSSKLSIHPSSSKMYQDLKPYFWWTKMKKEIVAYVARCDNCCRVKAIHMRPSLLQPLSVLGWKWEEIVMDFIIGLPTTERGFDSIWVIVDCLTKSATFIPVKTTYHLHNYDDIYFQQVVRLHGVPKSIVSDRGPQFIDHF
jgi:hypothetical protein